MELSIRRNPFYKWKELLKDKGEQASANQRGSPKKKSQGQAHYTPTGE